MLRIDRSKKELSAMQIRSLSDAGIMERYDLQQIILQNPDVFFAEMKEKLLLVGEEVNPTDVVDNRIDLLAVDKDAASVIIELKRGNNRLHLLQAMTYAAMLSQWQPLGLINNLSSFAHISSEEAKEKIESFIDEELSALNQNQRIILLAEDFDYEVLATAEWLTEKYDMDIRCYQLHLATDSKMEFLSCTCIYPAPELREHAVRRSKRSESSSNWSSWDVALEAVGHQPSKEFFRHEVNSGCEKSLSSRELIYRLDGKRRFYVGARTREQRAYVWQKGRFADDISFWKTRLDTPLEIEPVQDNKSLRFYLTTAKDFTSFKQSLVEELSKIKFLSDEQIENMSAEPAN
jgi:hypothetical protein